MENIEQINLFNKIRIDYYINYNFNIIHTLSIEEYVLFRNWMQQLTITELQSKEYVLKPIPLYTKKIIFHAFLYLNLLLHICLIIKIIDYEALDLFSFFKHSTYFIPF